MDGAVSVNFSVEELWFIHEHTPDPVMSGRTDIHSDLKEKTSDALVRCWELGSAQAPVPLDQTDCRLMLMAVPPMAWNVKGVAVGKRILLKTMAAWREMRTGKELSLRKSPQSEFDLGYQQYLIDGILNNVVYEQVAEEDKRLGNTKPDPADLGIEGIGENVHRDIPDDGDASLLSEEDYIDESPYDWCG